MEFPENLSELSVEALEALRTELSTNLDNFVAIEAPTVEQVTAATTDDANFELLQAEFARRADATTAAAGLRERQAARLAASTEATEQAEAERVAAEAATAEAERIAAEAAASDEEVEENRELAAVGATGDTASASGGTSTFNRDAAAGARPDRPAGNTPINPLATITAAPDVPGLAHGTPFNHLSEMAGALTERFQGFVPPAGVEGSASDWRQSSFATIRKNLNPEHVIRRGASEEEFWEVINRVTAAGERNDEQGLVAAGGWCSPSEVAYDLCEGESLDGILSVPEVGLSRGGLRYTMGPDWSDIFGNGYGVQTEAQAIAGTAKVPFEITCPTFTETRLDALYQFVKVPILTEAAYPELVKRWMRGLVVSYAHKKNQRNIALIAAGLTSGGTVNSTGSLAQDLIQYLINAANYQRELRRWSMKQAVEIVLPFWVKGAIQTDIAIRTGRNQVQVTDQEVAAIFAMANILPQWVYDGLEPLTSHVAYPGTFTALIYKAGTFVQGTNDVIKLDTVYDAASLATNIYTALFMEEGHNVMRMCQGGTKLTFSTACLKGRTGAHDLTCAP